MSRVTRTDVQAEIRRVEATAIRLGLPFNTTALEVISSQRLADETWKFQNPWRLPGLGVTPDDVLGNTASEALATLQTIRAAWQYVLDNRG